MFAWLGDLRHAVRALARTPGFALTATIILALGLGLTMYMFGALNVYILRPLPYPDHEELIHLELFRPDEGESSVTVHDFLDFRREQRSLESLAGFRSGTVNIGGDDYPKRFEGAFVTANIFDVIGTGPALGRTFLPGEDEVGAGAIMIAGPGTGDPPSRDGLACLLQALEPMGIQSLLPKPPAQSSRPGSGTNAARGLQPGAGHDPRRSLMSVPATSRARP